MKLKQWRNIFHLILNANSILQHIIQNKNGTKKKGQCECKSLNLKYEIDNNWNHSSCICEYNKYSKSVVDISVDECDEIVIVMNNLSTKKTNTIATNVTRDWYILHAVLLAIILLLMIIIICHHY